jgi:C4-dicarboxylate-specific signal transduction histidine kinase
LNKSELEFIAKNKENDFIPTLHKYWDTGLALHDMKLAADHTTHVIRSIKDLGGKSKGALKSCDIQSTITKSLALLKQVLKDINIKLEMDYDLSIHAIEGDLIQVWINLIKNAAESLTHAKTIDPKIKIQSSLKNNKIEIRITDNGPGIQKEVLPQIFQPSFSTKVTGLSFGLGLGLSIIEKIITSYSGQIKVHSKEGKTTFIVLFPNK